MDLSFLQLPAWAAAGINLLFYAYLVCLMIVFFRMTQDDKRALVVAWSVSGLLGWSQNLFSGAAADALDYFQAVAMLAGSP
jgi:hypothetical protein